MTHDARITLIAEGLPILLASAHGFWSAAESLRDRPREAEVLEGFADEEAAKILILIDIIRCPKRLVAARVGPMVSWFYNHLARLLYSDAQSWRPTDVSELQSYLNEQRKGHYLEGYVGEFIMPNWGVFARESVMYADIAGHEDGSASWNDPNYLRQPDPAPSSFTMKPKALETAEALHAVGAFSPRGLIALAEVWGAVEFKDTIGASASDQLIRAMLERYFAEDLPLEHACNEHVRRLRRGWQMPMYNLDFRLIEVPLADLEREREAAYMNEFGDWRDELGDWYG
jgi:hypothetical protein